MISDRSAAVDSRDGRCCFSVVTVWTGQTRSEGCVTILSYAERGMDYCSVNVF